MKKLLLQTYVIMIVIANCFISLEAAINKFTIYQLWKPELDRYNYVISCLNNEAAPDSQEVGAIKCLIDSEPNALFLFSGSPDEEKPKDSRDLMDYAITSRKPTLNIGNQLSIWLRRSGPVLAASLKPKALAGLIKGTIDQIEQDVEKVNQMLEKSVEDSFLIAGLALYLEYFDKLKEQVEECKNEMRALSLIEEDNFVEYLSTECPIINNMGEFVMCHFLAYPNLDFLRAFKAILEHQESSKIFLFTEHAYKTDYLQEMLLEMGYLKMHTYTCDSVEESLKEVDQHFANMLKLISKHEINEDDRRSMLFHGTSAGRLYSNLPTIPSYIFLGLMGLELQSDQFTNEYENKEVSRAPSHQISKKYDSMITFRSQNDVESWILLNSSPRECGGEGKRNLDSDGYIWQERNEYQLSEDGDSLRDCSGEAGDRVSEDERKIIKMLASAAVRHTKENDGGEGKGKGKE